MAEKPKSILSYATPAPNLGYRLVTPLTPKLPLTNKTPILPVMGQTNINVPLPIVNQKNINTIAPNLGQGTNINVPDISKPIINKSNTENNNDYRGQHTAPSPDFGASIDDVTANGMFPKDFYDKPDWYSGSESYDYESRDVIRRAKGRPYAWIKIYRAVPKDAPRGGINVGDWVTPSRKYAIEHGKSNLNNNYKIREKMVRAKDIFTDANSINEWGYYPQPPKPKSE